MKYTVFGTCIALPSGSDIHKNNWGNYFDQLNPSQSKWLVTYHQSNLQIYSYLLYKIVFDTAFNNVKYLHLSNKLVFYKKHKLLKSDVSEEACKNELALKLWNLSEELCRSFSFVSFNI